MAPDLKDAMESNPELDTTAAVNAVRDQIPTDSRAAADAQAEMQAQTIASAVRSGKRAFISPTFKNTTKLVQAGKLMACYPGTQVPVVAGQPGTGVEMNRVGDINARFTGGILIVDPNEVGGEEIISWAMGNPSVCRDVMDPSTETWASLRESQIEKVDQEPTLPPELDVDAVLRGDFSGFTQVESATQRARRMLLAEG